MPYQRRQPREAGYAPRHGLVWVLVCLAFAGCLDGNPFDPPVDNQIAVGQLLTGALGPGEFRTYALSVAGTTMYSAGLRVLDATGEESAVLEIIRIGGLEPLRSASLAAGSGRVAVYTTWLPANSGTPVVGSTLALRVRNLSEATELRYELAVDSLVTTADVGDTIRSRVSGEEVRFKLGKAEPGYAIVHARALRQTGPLRVIAISRSLGSYQEPGVAVGGPGEWGQYFSHRFNFDTPGMEVVVSGDDAEYEFYVQRIDERPEHAPRLLSPGRIEESIDFIGDVDVFDIPPMDGYSLLVSTDDVTGLPVELFTLRDRKQPPNDLPSQAYPWRTTLSTQGSYQVHAMPRRSELTGDYAFVARFISHAPEVVPADLTLDTWLPCEPIEPHGDVDQYRVSVPVAGTYQVDVRALGADPPQAYLSTVAEAWRNVHGRLTEGPPQLPFYRTWYEIPAGDYLLTIDQHGQPGAGDCGLGSYQVRMSRVRDQPEIFPDLIEVGVALGDRSSGRGISLPSWPKGSR